MSVGDWARFDPAYGLPAEFGELARQSGHDANDRSHAQLIGAENLLAKAMESTIAGDTSRAERLIGRAAAMPWDDREQAAPGVFGATLLVYDVVSGRYEASDGSDSSWLDVALDVHARAEGPARAELTSVIGDFARGHDIDSLSPTERRRIRAAVGDAPREADLGDRADLTVEQRAGIIRSLVHAAAELERGYRAVGHG